MRIAAIYDIHGNLPALEAVLEEIRLERVDQVVVGGDVIPGPMPRETLASVLSLNVPTRFLYGNCEVAVLEQLAGRDAAGVIAFNTETCGIRPAAPADESWHAAQCF